MLFRLLSILALFTTSYASEIYLLDRLAKAQNGDFIVVEANKTITLLAIRSSNEHTLLLEEISAPSPKIMPSDWADWLKKRAPGHTSWSMMEIDLHDRQVLEAYSFTRSTWMSTSSNASFLAGLLHLPLKKLPKEKLRCIGPPPLDGEPDQRKIWTPPLFVQGKQIKPVLFEAFETVWPQDGSEFAGKTMDLYFDREAKSHFPYWIQIDTGQITATLRSIDSGHKLDPSLYRTLPKRSPEFLGAPLKTKSGGLRFSIKSPKYYREFELFAIDVTTQDKQIHLLSHVATQTTNEVIHLEIEADELARELKPNHAYTWLITPVDQTGVYGELHKTFVWNPIDLLN